MKKNPKYIAVLYHKDAGEAYTRDYPFNVDPHEDMSKSDIEVHVNSKWPDLVIKKII